MTELVLLRGYSGSGKSTLARSWVLGADPLGSRVRVSRDDIRAMLTGSSTKTVLDYEGEQAVTRIERAAARDALKAGKDVIVDATNLVLRFAREWAALASDEGATFRVWDVQTPVADCIVRNQERHPVDRVPIEVIENQAKRFPFKNWQEVTPKQKEHSAPPAVYVPNPDLPDAIIVDIDGTLAHKHPDRDIYDGHLAHLDLLDPVVAQIVAWADMERIKIIVMSGRDSKYREVTKKWLASHTIWYEALHMREEGDNRPDFVVKGELFDEHLRNKYNVLFALDDRDQIVKLWRDMGVKCLQVEYGAF